MKILNVVVIDGNLIIDFSVANGSITTVKWEIGSNSLSVDVFIQLPKYQIIDGVDFKREKVILPSHRMRKCEDVPVFSREKMMLVHKEAAATIESNHIIKVIESEYKSAADKLSAIKRLIQLMNTLVKCPLQRAYIHTSLAKTKWASDVYDHFTEL